MNLLFASGVCAWQDSEAVLLYFQPQGRARPAHEATIRSGYTCTTFDRMSRPGKRRNGFDMPRHSGVYHARKLALSGATGRTMCGWRFLCLEENVNL